MSDAQERFVEWQHRLDDKLRPLRAPAFLDGVDEDEVRVGMPATIVRRSLSFGRLVFTKSPAEVVSVSHFESKEPGRHLYNGAVFAVFLRDESKRDEELVAFVREDVSDWHRESWVTLPCGDILAMMVPSKLRPSVPLGPSTSWNTLAFIGRNDTDRMW